ncbi:hypothetical protein ACP4OV_001964 [Aristida adscensionis]
MQAKATSINCSISAPLPTPSVMALNKKLAVGVFALALLLVAYCAEAQKMCEDPNHHFNGPCNSNKNCAVNCYHQNYIGGHCVTKNWYKKKKCYCRHFCTPPGQPSPPGEEPSPPGDGPPATILPASTIPGYEINA